MAESKKTKEQQILEEAADRMVAFMQDNTPIFKGEDEEVRKVILGKYFQSPSE